MSEKISNFKFQISLIFRPHRRGFTIIELVSVLAIIVVMLSIALGSYSGWTRAAGIDAAANLTATIFGHARDLAITQGVNAQVTCSNTTATGRAPCGMISVCTLDTFATNALPIPALPSNRLPAGITFRSATTFIAFQSDGSCTPDATVFSNSIAQVVLDSIAGDVSRRLTRVVEVNQLSGRIRVRREDEP